VRRLAKKSAWRAWWVIGRDYAVIGAAIVACEAFFHPLLYVLAVIVISARMSSVAGLGHEAAHYNLFRSKRANEWVGLVFCFSVVFFAVTPRAYRRSHLAHHRFTNMPGDPDPAIQGMPLVESAADAVMFFVRGVTLPVVYFVRELWRRPWFVQVAAVSAVATLEWALPEVARLIALYWVIPLLTGYSVFEFIRLNAEHNGVESDDPLYRTRTVIPTWLSRLTVAPEYVGYHLAHHIYPGVPFFRRKELHYALMEASEEYRANAHITRGYGRMLLELLRFRGGPLIRTRPEAPARS
jgi:fatty acid desaturase